VAAAFLGGTEKLKEGTDYGVPLVKAEDPVAAVEKALEEYDDVEVVVDLSDEPVVGYRERMRIASLVLAAGASYKGSDFELRPPEYHVVSTKPSLAVIGTGKRVGKTAVSGYLARLLSANGFAPGVVSMGRGGPPEPEVIDGHEMEVGSSYLLDALSRGAHAASDYYETAALSRVVTVGCRRCGGGLAGEPFVSNVLEGARLANRLDTRITVFDGSGAAVPPVAVGGRVLVAGAHQDPGVRDRFPRGLPGFDLGPLAPHDERGADGGRGEGAEHRGGGAPYKTEPTGHTCGLQAAASRRGAGPEGGVRLDGTPVGPEGSVPAPRRAVRV
jgi:cyclic 2,3-diphosphoglycerate synthetase